MWACRANPLEAAIVQQFRARESRSRRFKFGSNVLAGGIEFVPVLVGMFTAAEWLRNGTDMRPQHRGDQVDIKLMNIYKGLGARLWKYRLGLLWAAAIKQSKRRFV